MTSSISIDYKSLYQCATVGLWKASSITGKFIAVNEACAKILGCESIANVIGTYNLFLFQPQEKLIFLLKSKPSIKNYETKIKTHDNREIWVSISAKLTPEGFVEGSIEDITDYKNKENYLIEHGRKALDKILNIQETIKKQIQCHPE